MSKAPVNQTNRTTVIALLTIFLGPLLLAYVAYWGGWFEGRQTTNQGELLAKPWQLPNIEPVNKAEEVLGKEQMARHWWFVFVHAANECAEVCEQNLYAIQQARTALGEKSFRTDTLWLHQAVGLKTENYARWQAHGVTGQPAGIYVMDPLGNVILFYGQAQNNVEAVQIGKQLLADLKRLLKISRIG